MPSLTESWDAGDTLGGRFLAEWRGAAPGDRAGILGRYCDAYPQYAEVFRSLVEAGRIAGLGAPPIPEPEPSPRRLGAFRICREVPHLGMGRIYEAVQEPIGRRVAVKTIRGEAHRVSPEAEAKFLNEQHALARLHHTHIVPIFATGREGDIDYFAMPYIDGASLSRLVRTASSLASSGSSSQTPSLSELARVTADESEARGVDRGRVGATPPAPGRDGPVLATRSRRYLRSVASVLATAAEALQHAHEASRREAVEPDARRRGALLGDRLRPGLLTQREVSDRR